MAHTEFIGREREINRLGRCKKEDHAQLVVVYGRRRVGKTYLVDSFFEDQFAFRMSGAYDQPKEAQLKNFAMEMTAQTGERCETPKDWTEAFLDLRKYLSGKTGSEKCVVFFDEMPWMDTAKSGFLPAFEWFWNDWGSKQQQLIFVVCGSATSWMVDHIANNKGGLFNRQTCRLYLEPFSLYETEMYLKMRGMEWSRYEIVQCYMIMGGFPYYLSLLDPERSFSDNIDNLFFRKKAELWDEFEHLYRTLFSNSESYIKVVEALSKKRGGISRKELAEQAGLPSNGKLTKILSDLDDSGFIRMNDYYGHKKRDCIYQLSDYYTLFYFQYIRDHYGKDPHFWKNMIDNPSRRVWEGLTFEQICKDHLPQIKAKLGIAGVLSEESSWFVKPDEERGISDGAQIDLLIDRRDHVINLCEIKFSAKEFEIDKSYDVSLRNKIDAFVKATGSKKTITLTMITTYGVKQNKYSGMIRSQVTLDDLFRRTEEL